jgi:hypothetical protein
LGIIGKNMKVYLNRFYNINQKAAETETDLGKDGMCM